MDGLTGSYGSELELVASEGERARAVAVRGVTRDDGKTGIRKIDFLDQGLEEGAHLWESELMGPGTGGREMAMVLLKL